MASDGKQRSLTLCTHRCTITITLSVSIHTTLVETRPVVSLHYSSVSIHAKLVETRPDLDPFTHQTVKNQHHQRGSVISHTVWTDFTSECVRISSSFGIFTRQTANNTCGGVLHTYRGLRRTFDLDVNKGWCQNSTAGSQWISRCSSRRLALLLLIDIAVRNPHCTGNTIWLFGMSLSRISAEEIRGELEKLRVILTGLQENAFKDSSDLIFLRNKFLHVFSQKTKKSRRIENLKVCDRATKLVEEQQLQPFLPLSYRPAK